MKITFEKIMACHPDNLVRYNQLLTDLQNNIAIIPFIGAGLSKPLYKLWGEFLLDLAAKKGEGYLVDIKLLLNNNHFEKAASYLYKIYGRNDFNKALELEFSPEKISNNFSDACLDLPMLFQGPIVTTNYDHILEKLYLSYEDPFIDKCLPRQESDYVIIDRATKKLGHYLIKLHGDVDNYATRVLTEEEYDLVYNISNPFYQMLVDLFKRFNFIFLGCSLEGDRTIKTLQSLVDLGEMYNYGILPLPEITLDKVTNKSLLNDPTTGKRWEELAKKELQLSNLFINTIWYPYKSHESLHIILERLINDLGKKKAMI
ncbi:SIR2 family protein [Enterocloster aldenensis]|uniref:SIR2 family protein n=1 Tax=Enterocloster aldenensis TaxID=358742 RepID=UPI004027ADAC